MRILIGLMAAVLAGCGSDPATVAGGTGGMETENTIARLSTPDGSPAVGARVTVMRSLEGVASELADSMVIFSDSQGLVRLPVAVEPGLYGLAVAGGGASNLVLQLSLPLDSAVQASTRLGAMAKLTGSTLPSGATVSVPGTRYTVRVAGSSWSLAIPPGDFLVRAKDSLGRFLGEKLVHPGGGDSLDIPTFGDTTFATEHYQSWSRKSVQWLGEPLDSSDQTSDRIWTLQLAKPMAFTAASRKSLRVETGGDHVRLRFAVVAWDTAAKSATVQVRLPAGNKSKAVRLHWGMAWAPDRSCLSCVFDSTVRPVVRMN